MPTVIFTENLYRHIECPKQQVDGHTVAEALNEVFNENPKLAGYILDDQKRLRKHILITIDNQMISDRLELSDKVATDSEIYVLQALSGG